MAKRKSTRKTRSLVPRKRAAKRTPLPDPEIDVYFLPPTWLDRVKWFLLDQWDKVRDAVRAVALWVRLKAEAVLDWLKGR